MRGPEWSARSLSRIACVERRRGLICRALAGGVSGGGGGGGGASELTPEAKLLLSIAIDLVGMSTYAVPVAGESADLGWAPVSAALIFWL